MGDVIALPSGVQIPKGYKLVPIAPTEDMIVHGMEASCLGRPSIDDDAYVRSIWDAMLSEVSP